MLASCRLLLSLSRLAAEPCGSLAIMQAERIVASAGASTSQPQHALPLMATTPHHQAALLEQRRYYRMKQPWQHLPSRVLPDKIREIIENKLAERAANRIPDPVITLPEAPRELTPNTRRCGLVGMKVGMTHEWDEHGALVPLTVIWVDKCQVRERGEKATQWEAQVSRTRMMNRQKQLSMTA